MSNSVAVPRKVLRQQWQQLNLIAHFSFLFIRNLQTFRPSNIVLKHKKIFSNTQIYVILILYLCILLISQTFTVITFANRTMFFYIIFQIQFHNSPSCCKIFFLGLLYEGFKSDFIDELIYDYQSKCIFSRDCGFCDFIRAQRGQ